MNKEKYDVRIILLNDWVLKEPKDWLVEYSSMGREEKSNLNLDSNLTRNHTECSTAKLSVASKLMGSREWLFPMRLLGSHYVKK